MMDRNREARRAPMAAVNGGLSRRRQPRSTNLRDSPEDDGAMEMQEPSRLRDRGVKKDRDRDRDRSSSRSKRRRGERLMHGSNREEGDDSSEESMDDDEEEEEEDASVAMRLPAANLATMPSSSSSIQQQNHHHARKINFSAKSVRPAAASWKVADKMIGVSIPRKARSSSLKRSQECWVSGGGASGSGELIHRQSSTSPARPSPSSTAALSPSSPNASARKKKPISGTKHRPPKMAKSSTSSIQEDIEIEVAEVLFGMTRQTQPPPAATNKQEISKVDSKDTSGLSTEAKSRVSSPNSTSQGPSTSQPSVLPSPNLPTVATAPKRKRPRLKFDEESPTSPVSSVAPSTKMESEMPPKAEETSSPRSEKNTTASPAVENGIRSCDPSGPVHGQQDLAKPESSGNQVFDCKGLADGKEQGKVKEEVTILPLNSKDASSLETSVNPEEAPAAAKAAPANESPREEKFSIDLMAPPLPEKYSSQRDGFPEFVSDHHTLGPEKKMLPGSDIANGEVEKVEKGSKHPRTSDNQNTGNFLSDEIDLKKHAAKEKIHDLQLDLEKHDKDGLSLSCGSKQQQQQEEEVPKQQQKSARIDPKREKPATSASLPLTVPIAGWPGGFPPFGCIGQVPSLHAVVPMDGSSGAAKTVHQPAYFLQPQLRPKRCATHCYIAQNISYYQQQLARMNPFWSSPAAAAAAAATAAAVGAASLYGAKQYNLNAVPPSESAAILGNSLQGGFPPRSLGPLQDKSAPAVAMEYTGPPPKEKSSATAAATSNNFIEAAQRKQFLLQQSAQPGSSAAPPNMIQGPAFIFPINQQHAVANRSGASSKSTPGTGNAAPSAASASSAAAGSGAAGHSATAMNFNYAGLTPNDAQYMAILQNSAILQNNGYSFPIAAAHIGAPPSYRGASPAQAMPFFNGPFYSPQMVPSQQQQQQLIQQQQQQQQQQFRQHQHQQQPPAHPQQGHQNPSTSSGSSSSQKHTQQSQRVSGSGTAAAPAGSNSHSFPASKQQLHLLPPQARHLESEAGCEDSPSTADSSRASQTQKGLYGQKFAMPMHSQNFALISPAAAALAGSGAGGNHSENKQPGAHQHQQQPLQHQAVRMEISPSQAQAQAYAMSFAPFSGSAAATGAAPGFDFSAALMQNPALLSNLPDIARHGYQISAAAAAAAAAAAQAAPHKKSHHEDGKSGGDSAAANANAVTEEAKLTSAAGGGKSGGQQHSLSFSRPDNDPAISSFSNILADSNSRILNGGRELIPPCSAAPTSSAATAATNSPSSQHIQQQQQQMIQFQKQQQQRILQLQQQQQMLSRPAKSSSAHTSSANFNSDHLPAGSTMAARFPQSGLGAFPPSLIQGSSGGAGQSPQLKNSGRAATPAPASFGTSSSSSAKNQMPQQQQQQLGRSQQQHSHFNPGAHQTQISFGVTSSNKTLGAGGSNPSLSSAAAASVAAGSPQSSVSKGSAAAGGGNGGSPRASSSSKPGHPPASVLPTFPLQHQQSAAAKIPLSASSNLKSSPITNNSRNMTSILGHPHMTPPNSSSSSSSSKLQQQQQSQQQQQQLQKQSFQPLPQLFFNNPYIQAQTSPSNAAVAAGFYQQRRQLEQQQQQQKNSTTSGMLSLCPSSLTLAGGSATSDPAKAAAAAAAASGIKGLTSSSQAGILQHSEQYAATSMATHPLMSGAFPYIHTMPSSVSVKPAAEAAAADQKQSTTGSDNMHACWKTDKR